MTKYYRVPMLSKVAYWVAFHLLPNRVCAWIWIAAYQDLDRHYRDVDDHHPDGSRSLYRAVREIRVENLMRRMWYDVLKATTYERNGDQKRAS